MWVYGGSDAENRAFDNEPFGGFGEVGCHVWNGALGDILF